jgi:hypothetical protein
MLNSISRRSHPVGSFAPIFRRSSPGNKATRQRELSCYLAICSGIPVPDYRFRELLAVAEQVAERNLSCHVPLLSLIFQTEYLENFATACRA